ncbi:Uncharacterised protein [Mycobacteroides abscessus]|nr:Uncharacterised protein [Mycobacteroides abscessus]
MANRVGAPGRKAGQLLLAADREPQLDQVRTRIHQHPFIFRSLTQELRTLRGGAVAHHALDTCPVVPGTVHQHDLATAGQVGGVPLEIPLRLLYCRRLLQRHHARTARVEMLGEPLDRSPLAGGVAPLEDDAYLLAVLLDPQLQLQQFDLQLALGLLVLLAGKFFVIGIALFPGVLGLFAATDTTAQAREFVEFGGVVHRDRSVRFLLIGHGFSIPRGHKVPRGKPLAH